MQDIIYVARDGNDPLFKRSNLIWYVLIYKSDEFNQILICESIDIYDMIC